MDTPQWALQESTATQISLECKSQGSLLRAASECGDTSIVKKLLNEDADVSCDIVSGIMYYIYLLYPTCIYIDYVLSKISL